MSLAVVPVPGSDLVPDGWCEAVVVPWADEQSEHGAIAEATAKLAGLIAAYQTMKADALELVKARRYLEVRWGELLGDGDEAMRSGKADPSLTTEGSLITKDQRHEFRQLAQDKPRVAEAIREATDTDDLSRAALLRKVNGAHVGNNSGDNEWYTPVDYIEAARAVMGGIDFDPASSREANEIVGAERFCTPQTDGLKQTWAGRVWMNPPYAQPAVEHFCVKLAESFTSGSVEQACVLVNNATETGWFQTLAVTASAICFPRGRVKFWHPRKESTPLQGQAFIYFGEHANRFRGEAGRFGFTVAL